MESVSPDRLSHSEAFEYAEEHSTPLPPFLAGVRERYLDEIADPEVKRGWVSGTLEGRFLAALVHARQARNVLEVGTFVGYGAIAMASALPSGGRIITCEIDTGY